jgi:hypothetical protein
MKNDSVATYNLTLTFILKSVYARCVWALDCEILSLQYTGYELKRDYNGGFDTY